MPWLGSPTSYASGYIRAHRTSAASQSLTTEFTSPPTYWTGLRTSGSSGSSRGYTDGTGIITDYRCSLMPPAEGRAIREGPPAGPSGRQGVPGGEAPGQAPRGSASGRVQISGTVPARQRSGY